MLSTLSTHAGAHRCTCTLRHSTRKVVLTGGPGAGKTAALELIQKTFCHHLRVLPEAAGILFGGGFPRFQDVASRRSAQRAIFSVQNELEVIAGGWDAALTVCDRGTIDGIAYWPGPDDFWEEMGTTEQSELARYHAVVHLRTPHSEAGYNHQNPLRIESPEEAVAIDDRIAAAWARHPNHFVVDRSPEFITKLAEVVRIIKDLIPACCRV